MAEIKFWKWQYGDSVDKRRVTRHLLSEAGARERLQNPETIERPLEIRDGKQRSPSDFLRAGPK